MTRKESFFEKKKNAVSYRVEYINQNWTVRSLFDFLLAIEKIVPTIGEIVPTTQKIIATAKKIVPTIEKPYLPPKKS
ncbi:MAG: hypothetical protein F6K35_48680 [Okeania sp. SIO2H7]|nr:hypothetical protein [Okeania sp. SIO2H7]